jgi:hypothetical protein
MDNFEDTYAFYCFLKGKATGPITRLKTFFGILGDLGQEYRNLTPEEKMVYEEKANHLTEREIRYVQVHIAPTFEAGYFESALIQGETSQRALIDAHLPNADVNIDTNNNMLVGDIGLKYPGYLVYLNELDYKAAAKYTDYKIIAVDPNDTDILFKVEAVNSTRLEPGKWDILIDFTVQNIASRGISISNIEAFLNYRDISRKALTIGERDGLDLTKYGSLRHEGKYYDLAPQEEQKVTLKLRINRWWGIPNNSINGSLRILFSISIDYHTVRNDREVVIKRILPTVFCFDYSEATSQGGNCVYLYDKNIDMYYRKHRGCKELISILSSISDFLNIARCKAIILWESAMSTSAQREPNMQSTSKVLFLSANPSDQSRLQTDREHRIIKAEIEKGRRRDSFEFLPSRFAVTVTELLHAMNDRPAIVHFSGHGETKGILIVTDSNQTQLVPIEALTRLFAPLMGITKVVLLNSCYSAEQAKIISKYGMFVIGMNLPIEDDAAISFAKGLYNGLGEGKTIEGSYNDAMIVLETENPNYAKMVEAWKDGKRLRL